MSYTEQCRLEDIETLDKIRELAKKLHINSFSTNAGGLSMAINEIVLTQYGIVNKGKEDE